jgi:hypothetical protein
MVAPTPRPEYLYDYTNLQTALLLIIMYDSSYHDR